VTGEPFSAYAALLLTPCRVNFFQKVQKLCQLAYPFKFSVNDYDIRAFNEQNVPNTFIPGLKVNDNK